MAPGEGDWEVDACVPQMQLDRAELDEAEKPG
jgi:hypothetical protein